MIPRWLTHLWERLCYGNPPAADRRSPHWPAVEREHKHREPACQWCGRLDHIEVHHITGFEEDPLLELDDGRDGSGKDGNLITLCRPPGSLFGSAEYLSGSCHFLHGHRDPLTGKTGWKYFDHSIRARCESHRRSTR